MSRSSEPVLSRIEKKGAQSGSQPQNTAPVFGGLTNTFGTSVVWKGMNGLNPRIKNGANPHGSTKSNERWAKLNLLAPVTSKTDNYYIRGHLLNNNLGGPGDDWENLTPLTSDANNRDPKSHLRAFEEHVKNAVLEDGKTVDFVVKAIYGRGVRTVDEAQLDNVDVSERKIVKEIITEEQFVPTALECSAVDVASNEPVDKKPPESGKIDKIVTIVNDTDKTPGDYCLNPEKYKTYQATMGKTTALSQGINLEVTIGKQSVTLNIQPNKVTPVPLEKAKSFKGLILKSINKASAKNANGPTYKIVTQIDPAPEGGVAKLEGTEKGIPPQDFNLTAKSDDDTSKAVIANDAIQTKFGINLTFASPGTITKVTPNADGTVGWEGVVKPTIPVLPSEVRIAYDGQQLRLEAGTNATATEGESKAAKAPTEKSKKANGASAPKTAMSDWFRVTRSTVSADIGPKMSGSGDIEAAIGPQSNPIAKIKGNVSLGEEGFTATGDLTARVPGLKETTVHATYADGAWAARAEISAEAAGLPFSPTGNVVLDINGDGIHPSGKVTLTLPGDSGQVTLDFIRDASSGKFIFTGTGQLTLPIPGAKDKPKVKVGAKYDGEQFVATAEGVSFSWNGIGGTLQLLTYRQPKDGEAKTSGKGMLNIKRGEVAGSITVAFDESGQFSGNGTLSYPFKVGKNEAVATGTVEMKNGKVLAKGDMSFAKPIDLFDKFGSFTVNPFN